MRYALLSDVHGKTERLRLTLDDIRRRGAGRIISLGDVGGDAACAMLRDAGAVCVFGNWEVSGLGRLTLENQESVARWPAVWEEPAFLAAHAAPHSLAGLSGPADVARYMQTERLGWRDLFPYVTENEDALWGCFAELAGRGRRILFHGHTHVQSGWRLDGQGQLHALRGPHLLAGACCDEADLLVVGVGSVGLPDDGDGIAYTWYDSDSGALEWVRLP
jgi:hypothetical protein